MRQDAWITLTNGTIRPAGRSKYGAVGMRSSDAMLGGGIFSGG